MHTTDEFSMRFVIKILIPLIILGGYWIYGFIKGLMEKDPSANSNPKKDIKYYSKKIKSEPYNYEHYFERGTARLYLDDYNGALGDLNKAIELNPKYWNAYGNRALVYYKLNREHDALNDYSRAIEFNPDTAVLYYNRANIYYYSFQDCENAISDLKIAIELQPEDEDYLSLYGKIKYELENRS